MVSPHHGINYTVSVVNLAALSLTPRCSLVPRHAIHCGKSRRKKIKHEVKFRIVFSKNVVTMLYDMLHSFKVCSTTEHLAEKKAIEVGRTWARGERGEGGGIQTRQTLGDTTQGSDDREFRRGEEGEWCERRGSEREA